MIRRNFYLLLICLCLAACENKPQLPRLSDDAVLLSFGDSLTFGTGAAKNESYPKVLEQLSGHTVINAGVPGEISEQGLLRLPGLLAQHRPNLLILCHGGNDMLKKKDLNQASDNIHKMIQLAQQQGIPVILIAVPKPGLFLNPAAMYRNIAESTGVLLIDDLIPEVLSDANLKSDPVHPNKAGYRKIAEHIVSVLRQNGAI